METKLKEPIIEYGKVYTYADYLTWTIHKRYEIIKGKLFKMSPAPSRTHQKVSMNLTEKLLNFFRPNYTCDLFAAPFDVRLEDPIKKSRKDEDIISVVQPDLCVICDEEKLDERGCIGAPDLVIEILSPGNSKKEMSEKFNLYEENKVKEYWMVEPSEQVIYRYVLRNEGFIGLKPLTVDEEMSSPTFPDLQFSIIDIFPKK